MGASGSGTTTLGIHLATKLNWEHLDVDDYYWEKSYPPFQFKVPFEKRKQTLSSDFEASDHIVLSGSLVSWGEEWKTAFDLIIFLSLEHNIRMSRLKTRELERYGEQLELDETIKKQSTDFLEWAAKYDDPSFDGRSLRIHEAWLNEISCPVLRLSSSEDVSSLRKKALEIILKL